MTNNNITWVGMDTDADKAEVALYRGWETEPSAEFRIEMDSKGIKKLIEKLKKEGEVRTVYEAGPCGYPLARRLRQAGIACDVIAPSLALVKKVVFESRIMTPSRNEIETLR